MKPATNFRETKMKMLPAARTEATTSRASGTTISGFVASGGREGIA
jgi:hypothetical protein